MKRVSFAIVAVIAFLISSASVSAAPILLVDASGELTGAQGVEINGQLYDVSFVDGSCVTLFAPCTAVSDFDFSSEEAAWAAMQALASQVFVGVFDTSPSLTAGCEHLLNCSLFTPYGFAVPTGLRGVAFANSSVELNDAVFLGIGFPQTFDTGGSSFHVYADFEPSELQPVPEPASLLLLGGGLAGIAAKVRKRRKQPTA